MADYYTGLDLATFPVTADFPLDGVPAGEELAPRFQQTRPGVWELRLTESLPPLDRGRLAVSVRDRQGNETRIEQDFTVATASRE